MSAAEIATELGIPSTVPQFDRELANWQRQIASTAANGGGLDMYQAALNWVKQDVPPDNALREKAKQEIREAAERDLADVHGVDILDAIYFCVFPEDATSNDDLDADILTRDRPRSGCRNCTTSQASKYRIRAQRKAAAEKLGIIVSLHLTTL